MTLVLNGTTGVSAVDGSASTPAIQGNDTNTGIFFPAADTVAIATGGTEAMRVNSSQNVGIGTSSPDGRLHVMTASAGSVTADADADDLTVEGSANPGISILGTGDDVCSVYFGNPGSNGQKDGGIRYFQESFATVADRRSMTFITGTLERARIDSSGYLLINRTTNSTSSYVQIYGAQPALSCESTSTGGVNQVLFRNPNGTVGSIGTSATSTSYNTSSDYRLKKNIAPMTGALARVAALKPVTYKWKVDGSGGEGFIAHELQAVVPDCVTGEKDAVNEDGSIKPQGIDTSFLSATLAAAIQELHQIVQAQAAEIAELKANLP
jgi:hypothetical protein